jgi:hypothetical protein
VVQSCFLCFSSQSRRSLKDSHSKLRHTVRSDTPAYAANALTSKHQAVERDSLLSCNIITLRTRLFCVCFRFICCNCSTAFGWLQLLLVTLSAAHHDIVQLKQHNVTRLERVENRNRGFICNIGGGVLLEKLGGGGAVGTVGAMGAWEGMLLGLEGRLGLL